MCGKRAILFPENAKHPVLRSILSRGIHFSAGQKFTVIPALHLNTDVFQVCHQIALMPKGCEARNATLLAAAGRAFPPLAQGAATVAATQGSTPAARFLSAVVPIVIPLSFTACWLDYGVMVASSVMVCVVDVELPWLAPVAVKLRG